jgi:solute carrier family 1 (neutral amino acid transporter) protein 5
MSLSPSERDRQEVSLSLPHRLDLFRDRSCTILNVEGDAFGAGLLQSYVDRTKSPSSEPELIQVKRDVPLTPLQTAPEEGNPLLKHPQGPGSDAATYEKEAVM